MLCRNLQGLFALVLFEVKHQEYTDVLQPPVLMLHADVTEPRPLTSPQAAA